MDNRILLWKRTLYCKYFILSFSLLNILIKNDIFKESEKLDEYEKINTILFWILFLQIKLACPSIPTFLFRKMKLYFNNHFYNVILNSTSL